MQKERGLGLSQQIGMVKETGFCQRGYVSVLSSLFQSELVLQQYKGIDFCL